MVIPWLAVRSSAASIRAAWSWPLGLGTAPATDEVAVLVELHVARRHRDGPTAWRPRTALDLKAQVLGLLVHDVDPAVQ